MNVNVSYVFVVIIIIIIIIHSGAGSIGKLPFLLHDYFFSLYKILNKICAPMYILLMR